MIALVVFPFVGLIAAYFLVKSYFLKNVYVIKPTKAKVPRSNSEIKEVQHLIQIIRARRTSQTSLNKFCSSSSLDDLSIDIDSQNDDLSQKTNPDDLKESNDTFTDLNKWLENVPSSKEFTEINLSCDDQATNQIKANQTDQPTNHEINESTKQVSIKYLNLNVCDQSTNCKQFQILTSLSYLVNEERLSILVSKLKLPFYKNLYPQFSFYRRSMNSNQNSIKIYQQLELIKQIKYIFVKIYLIDTSTQKRKRISKKKTSLLAIDGQNTILNNNPYNQNRYIIINEMMIFKLPIDQLSKIAIRLSVLGLSSLKNLKQQLINQNDLELRKLGHIEIGCNSLFKSGFLHYQNLLSNLRKPVCMWHNLEFEQSKRKLITS